MKYIIPISLIIIYVVLWFVQPKPEPFDIHEEIAKCDGQVNCVITIPHGTHEVVGWNPWDTGDTKSCENIPFSNRCDKYDYGECPEWWTDHQEWISKYNMCIQGKSGFADEWVIEEPETSYN